MPKFTDVRLQIVFEKMLSDAISRLNESLLETCADQEYRICLLELGITL